MLHQDAVETDRSGGVEADGAPLASEGPAVAGVGPVGDAGDGSELSPHGDPEHGDLGPGGLQVRLGVCPGRDGAAELRTGPVQPLRNIPVTLTMAAVGLTLLPLQIQFELRGQDTQVLDGLL